MIGVESFWHQQETARKVLRSFRGRAILADEVGLGKTIEACLILKEYILRGLVKSALILAPSSLINQWKEELKCKFDLDVACLDGSDVQGQSGTILAGSISIGIAPDRQIQAEYGYGMRPIL